MKETHKNEILSIKINFQVTETIKRFVYIHAILAEKVYLIDAGVADSIGQIQSALKEAGRDIDEIAAILLTHTHPDHIGSAAKIKEVVPQCSIYVAANEKEWLEHIDLQYQQRPIPNFYQLAGSSVVPDVLLQAGDVIPLEEDIVIEVMDCSGHSHGSIGYFWEAFGTMFSGDAIPAINDVPIFSSLSNSIKTIYRLQNKDNIRCIYSAWEECKCGDEIKTYLAWAGDMLTGISSAITQVMQTEEVDVTCSMSKYELVCETLGLSALQEHPLFIRSIKAGMQEYYDQSDLS